VGRQTLLDFFDDLARTSGEFLVYDDGFRTHAYSYEDVVRAARGFASRLTSSGVRSGDKVVVWSENRPEWIVAFWGCVLCGIVVVPIDYRSSPDVLERIRRIVSAKVVLVGQEVPPVDSADSDPTVWPLHEMNWAIGSPPQVRVAADDVAEVIFTSGATGEPRGVLISHRNILANIVAIEREIMKYRKWGRPFFPLRFLNLLPLSHMFGQTMATFIPPMLPGTVIFMRGHDPGDIAALVKRRRVSVIVAVPKILELLRTHVTVREPGVAGLAVTRAIASNERRREHWILRWWRYRRVHSIFGLKFWSFVVGAAPLDADLEAFWSELGFAVIQGYGLTETAPVVSVTNPFDIRRGSVGKAISGVNVKIAPNGEILVRGDNVTKGYFNAESETAKAFEDGWFHTGDVGELTPEGRLFIRGRLKELIVTPEGMKVFPEDVERVLNAIPGVRDSAAVGVAAAGGASNEQVNAVLVLDPGVNADAVVRDANSRLEAHQKIRRALVWPEAELPRTPGTAKLKRAAIREWIRGGVLSPSTAAAPDALSELIAKYSGRTDLSPSTTIEELGLSSLDRVELMVALEASGETRLDERAFTEAHNLGELRALVERSSGSEAPRAEPIAFPSWNRSWPARTFRRIIMPILILPLTRLFAWTRVEGLDGLSSITGPVVFAANHQSFMDTPVLMSVLPARWRYRLAPAMAKEFFDAHFHPGTTVWFTSFRTSVGYYLATLAFNAFPLPQREAGARQALRYMGELVDAGYSILIFPEGHHTDTGEIDRFKAGIGMIAARLNVPVVPIRLEGVDRVLHRSWRMARPGRVRVSFGKPLTLAGDDFEALASQVEQAVVDLD
jgi:long-chain acyl-CoA synthetase